MNAILQIQVVQAGEFFYGEATHSKENVPLSTPAGNPKTWKIVKQGVKEKTLEECLTNLVEGVRRYRSEPPESCQGGLI